MAQYTEFQVISYWESLDAIRAYAGEDVRHTRDLPRDREFLVGMEPLVRNYQLRVKALRPRRLLRPPAGDDAPRLRGASETLRVAAEFGAPFRLHHVGPVGHPRTSLGLSLGGVDPLPDRLPAGAMVIIPGVEKSPGSTTITPAPPTTR
jgi:hypothetical protein